MIVRCPKCETSLSDSPRQDRCIACGYLLPQIVDLSATQLVQSTLDERRDGPLRDPVSVIEPTRLNRFGRYRVLSTLGEGGFGTVYRALDETLQREVAIKVAKPRPGCTAEEAAFIVSEARIVASLDHPAIVPVFDSGWTEAGQFFMVCKFLEGSDLRKKLNRIRPDCQETALLIATVAEGLHHAHSRKLVHRDVKPGNILLDGSSHPYLTDFGLALFATQTAGRDAIAGTPSYMSPEQWAGESLDGRTDIWSLGVVLYEMLTGYPPFHGKDLAELMIQIRDNRYRRLSPVTDNIPKALIDTCHLCLCRERDERFATAAEMAEQLRRSIVTRAPSNTTPSRSQLLGRTADGFRLKVPFSQVMADPGSLIGTDISTFRIQAVLGAGGSGVVLKAFDGRLGRDICVKIAYPIRADLSAALRTLTRCLRGLLTLDHPNIVKIYDFGPLHLDDASSFYLMTEYVNGQPLQDWTRELPQIDESTWRSRLQVARAITETMHAAHQATYLDEVGFEVRGILHGDIKPNNILIRPNNQVAINDFMLVDVQRLIEPETSPPLPTSGDYLDTGVFGTPGFMAPEQEHRGVVTVRTDIFGLGRTFIELFFPGVAELQPLLTYGDPRLRPLCELIATMTAPDPASRPVDMRAVAERLDGACQCLISGSRPGLRHRLRRWLGF
jgi:serine/threonine protein kinase